MKRTFGSHESLVDHGLKTIPAFSAWGAFSPFLLLVILVPASAALVAPADVLDQYAFARNIVLLVQGILPSWGWHAVAGIQPQSALLSQCLGLLSIPFCAAFWLVNGQINYSYFLRRRQIEGRPTLTQYAIVALVAPALFLGAFYLYASVLGNPAFAPDPAARSRTFMAFCMAVLVYINGLALGAQLLGFRLFLDLNIKRK